MKALILTIFVTAAGASSAQANQGVACKCTKVWRGGPSQYFVGETIRAGTVTGDDMAEAVTRCRFTRPVHYYNPELSNCSNYQAAESNYSSNPFSGVFDGIFR